MKNELNILFTCSGRRVVLLEEFRRAMKDMGVSGQILAADLADSAATMKIADRAFVMPRVDNDDYIPAVRKIVSDHSVGLIVPLTDLDLHLLSISRDVFVEAGCDVMIGDDEIISICRDKILFMDFLSDAGLPSIRTMTIDRFRQNPFYPCFVKPVEGSAGKGAMKIENGDQFDHHVQLFGPEMLVQEYIPGSEYTIDVFCDWSGEVKSVVPRQRLEIRSGEVDKAVTRDDRDLVDAAVKLSEAFGKRMRGVFCCQCRRNDDGEICFFDVNTRFGGGAVLSIAAGVDLPRYVIEEVLGLESSAKMGQFKSNLLMMRYSQHVCCEVDDPLSLPGAGGPIVR